MTLTRCTRRNRWSILAAMKPFKQLVSFSLISLVSVGALGACGDDGDDKDPAGKPDGGGTSPSALIEKLSACPVINNTSDPSASLCLLGKYDGKTLSGESCSLTLSADGGYSFDSPKLNVVHTSPDKTIFIFGHQSYSGFHQLSWKVADPIDTDTFYDLDFTARFGTGVPAADTKIEIEVIEHADTNTTVSCIVTL